MELQYLKQRRVLVVGCGLTGASVVRYLGRNGIAFDLVGQRACDELGKPSDGLDDWLQQGQVFDVLDEELSCAYDILVLSPGFPRASAPIVAALVADVEVIGDIELFADTVEAPVIAVTGSNGKSTVVSWLASVATRCGVHAVACGNIGKPALDALDTEVELYVLELSSYQLESTTSLKALTATVLNVSDDHLDRYDSMEHYAAVKRAIYRQASLRIVNADDKRTWPNADEISTASVAYTHSNRAATVASEQRFTLASQTLPGAGEGATVVDADLSGPSNSRWHRESESNVHWLCRDRRRLLDQATLNLPGEHNVSNALAVLALLEPLALPEPEMLTALAAYRGLPHRTEFIGERDGVRWYNDSKGTNVDACAKAIRAMPGPVVLIAGGIGKGADFAPLRFPVAAYVHTAILIGVDAPRIASALDGSTRLMQAATLDEAIAMAHDVAHEGDVVLLSPACASFDMFDNFEHRGDCFKSSVREVLAA